MRSWVRARLAPPYFHTLPAVPDPFPNWSGIMARKDAQSIIWRKILCTIFVEERQLRRLGGLEPVRVDCRILCATNQDLAAKIKAGTFREELYYRLGVVTVKLPPLRERIED